MLLRALRSLFGREVENLRGLYTDPPSSAANEYPEVPAPEAPLSPMLLAARWASHDLYGEDMPGIALNLLEAEFDTPALRRLAGETQIRNSADAEPLVGRMFRELGLPYPLQEQQARWIVSRQLAREVIAGRRNAWAAASHLEIVVWGWAPANADLETIFSISDEIDWDVPQRRSLSELNTALIAGFARIATMTLEGLDVPKLSDTDNSEAAV
jgi:hypothetical protein